MESGEEICAERSGKPFSGNGTANRSSGSKQGAFSHGDGRAQELFARVEAGHYGRWCRAADSRVTGIPGDGVESLYRRLPDASDSGSYAEASSTIKYVFGPHYYEWDHFLNLLLTRKEANYESTRCTEGCGVW